jgi:hypothetical protein
MAIQFRDAALPRIILREQVPQFKWQWKKYDELPANRQSLISIRAFLS